MGVFIAVIIILVLILYALKDLLSERDFSTWINIALTALVLFTVILSIFMILHKGDRTVSPEEKNKPVKEAQAANSSDNKPVDEKSDDELMLEIAEEYTIIENDYRKNNPDAKDYKEVSSNYIKQKYGFTDEEWSDFVNAAEQKNLFEKAKKKINGDKDINYLIAK